MIRAHAVAAALCVLSLVAAREGTAQTTSSSTVTGTVTLNIPVKLTGLSPEIYQVRADCRVNGEGVSNPTSTTAGFTSYPQPTNSGAVDATLSVPVVVAVNIYNAGKTATYSCFLKARRTNSSTWESFSPTSTIPALKVNVTQPDQGTFTW